MAIDRDNLIGEATRRSAQGVSEDEIIAWLKQTGATTVDAICVVAASLGVSLGDAKRLVASHPAWAQHAASAAAVHDDAIRAAADVEREARADAGKRDSRRPEGHGPVTPPQ